MWPGPFHHDSPAISLTSGPLETSSEHFDISQKFHLSLAVASRNFLHEDSFLYPVGCTSLHQSSRPAYMTLTTPEIRKRGGRFERHQRLLKKYLHFRRGTGGVFDATNTS